MSKLRIGQAAVAAAMLLGFAILPGSCLEVYIDGNCAEDSDCHTEWNYSGLGTICAAGRCRCLNPEEEPCCPNGSSSCENDVFDCRAAAECELCATDAECPQPPSPLCGRGFCVEEKCQLEIRVGEEVKSQRMGDCKVVSCTVEGATIELDDPSDIPLDGNPCTYDMCHDNETENVDFPDGFECPGVGHGVCIKGKCQKCDEDLGFLSCPDGLTCFGTDCIPIECKDLQQNGEETYVDCGGSKCRPCDIGRPCLKGRDCLSGVCIDNECQAPTHTDGVKNDSETGVDCGYPESLPNSCADGEGCISKSDCQSGVCYAGVCQVPTCEDAVKNGKETGKDCGGDCDPCLN